MKSTILRSAGAALACALALAACGGDGDLYLQGSVSGVTKDGLILQNDGGDDVAVTAPYQSFQFKKRVSTDDQYNITVKQWPSNVEKCVVNNGSARANYYTIGQISVVCTIKTHALQVKVNGLTTEGLVLVNGTDRRPVAANQGSVEMTRVNEDARYGITILTQPTGQTCTVGGGDNGTGSGTMRDKDLIDSVVVNCA